MTSCRQCIVRGRVQGVFFRDSTRQYAVQSGISGSATNLTDGSVEVIACGDTVAVQNLCEWLWQGPQMASVTSVECQDYDGDCPSGFSIY